MESRARLLKDGLVTFVGKNDNGDDLEVTAEVRDLKVESEVEVEVEEYLSTRYERYPVSLPRSQEITLSAVVKDTYTIKVTPAPSVERTARVLGWSDPEGAKRTGPTISRIREAAAKAGVDESTPFELIYEENCRSFAIDVYIEFRWTD